MLYLYAMKIGIVGTGIAGMACGHYLKDAAEVFFHEKNNYAGGHTNTITVTPPLPSETSVKAKAEPAGLNDYCGGEAAGNLHIDTGFMVFNHVTYPHLLNLFGKLKVPTYPTDMSFSVQFLPGKLEYCGSGINGLFAQRKNIFSLRHIRMLNQIRRFNNESIKIMHSEAYSGYTLERYVAEKRFGGDMLWRYLIPMSAAVWSAPMSEMLAFPAQTLVNFFYNHGFLGLHTQHQWYTVTGGSRTYRDALMQPFRDKILLNDPVVKIIREDAGGVLLVTKNGIRAAYDKVVVACHADEALAMLENPSEDEKRLLGKFRYQKNIATLHTDNAVMPKSKRAWSSWNFRVEQLEGTPKASCTYWMNSLQKLPGKTDYFVTLNDTGNIEPKKILKVIEYTHPLFDVEAVKAQKELPELNRKGHIYFCGSYFRYGFHEDALVSAVNVSRQINPHLHLN